MTAVGRPLVPVPAPRGSRHCCGGAAATCAAADPTVSAGNAPSRALTGACLRVPAGTSAEIARPRHSYSEFAMSHFLSNRATLVDREPSPEREDFAMKKFILAVAVAAVASHCRRASARLHRQGQIMPVTPAAGRHIGNRADRDATLQRIHRDDHQAWAADGTSGTTIRHEITGQLARPTPLGRVSLPRRCPQRGRSTSQHRQLATGRARLPARPTRSAPNHAGQRRETTRLTYVIRPRAMTIDAAGSVRLMPTTQEPSN